MWTPVCIDGIWSIVLDSVFGEKCMAFHHPDRTGFVENVWRSMKSTLHAAPKDFITFVDASILPATIYVEKKQVQFVLSGEVRNKKDPFIYRAQNTTYSTDLVLLFSAFGTWAETARLVMGKETQICTIDEVMAL
jgi:hypothetical protein